MVEQAGGLQRRRLSWQQPLQSKQNQVYVYSETELLAALSNLPLLTGDCYGKSIIVAASIQLTKAILLAAGRYDGLTILSPGRATINCQAFAITIAASDVVVRDLDFLTAGIFTISGARCEVSGVTFTNFKGFSISGADTVVSNIFKMSGATGAGPAFTVNAFGVSISNVKLSVGTAGFTDTIALGASAGESSFSLIKVPSGASTTGILVSAPSAVSNISVLDCVDLSSAAVDSILISGTFWVVRGNYLPSTAVIRTGASGDHAVIHGNIGIGSIITTAGIGFNTIVGNVGVTTITPDAADAVGLNT